METILKLSINIDNSSVELEGQTDAVINLFNDIRLNGLGKLQSLDLQDQFIQKKEKAVEAVIIDNTENFKEVAVTAASLPSLNDLVIKLEGCTEMDWILIYCLYLSNNGNETFTVDDIRNKYQETNRFTRARSKNFSTNLKKIIKNSYISTVNSTEYKITTIGLEKAQTLLTNEVKAKSYKKNNKTYAAKTFKLVEIDMSEQQRMEFKTYFDQFEKLSNIDKAVVISWWLKENLGIDEIDKDILFTMLKTAGKSTSYDLVGSLKNAKNAKNYFVSGSSRGFYKLHHIGEDYCKDILMKEE